MASDIKFSDVVERTFREYLDKADEVPITGNLSSAITDVATSLTLDTSTLPPEHSYLIGPNTVLELDYEWALVRTYDPTTGVATVEREWAGTTKEAHSGYVRIAPETGRQRVLDALLDTIDELWPRLGYLKSCVETVGSNSRVELPEECEQVLHVEIEDLALEVEARFSRSPNMSSTSRALITDLGANTSLYVEYLARPGRSGTADRVDDRDEFLTDWNVSPGWQRLLMVGVLADLAVTRDLSAANLEALTKVIEQQGFPVGSGTSISRALRRYQDELIRAAAGAIVGASKTTAAYFQPF